MTMQEHLDACKRRAFELKATHPDLKHTKRLDLAAQSLGYAHYTALDKMLKLLGPDIAPSRIAILEAGGNAADSPFRLVTSEFGVGWSNKSGVKESVQSPSAADRTGMTEQDVRAVIERCHDLTHFGLGVSRGEIERHGSYRKALDAGQSMLIAHLDECNKSLRFLAHV